MGTARSHLRRVGTGLAGAVTLAALTVFPAGAAGASPLNSANRNDTYLALGDSVAFGYQPSNESPPPDYLDASSFVGYPEDVAAELGMPLANASCPGETTASMLYPGAQSNGCENSVGSSYGYRSFYPLHVAYQGTQMQYALQYLAAHRHTRLVTIDIGANDAFLCQATTADQCSSPAELQSVAAEVGQNLSTIFAQIRHDAHYGGPLVALTYYSTSYTDPTQVAGTEFLDQVIAGVARRYHAFVADGFAAFQAASQAAGGDPCAAGLLIKVVGGGCNIHPSAYGHQVLAEAVEAALPGTDRR